MIYLFSQPWVGLEAFWLCVTLVVIQFINLTRSLLMMERSRFSISEFSNK
ncbi:hypothetical protein [Nostoc sp. 'Peltigera membranacea cyanobiont' 210A]|nr:hypothetical protein [Nostoc sp. 'Peltigera membranacea cyanobiont' 210A]